jgi:hypothetical protein
MLRATGIENTFPDFLIDQPDNNQNAIVAVNQVDRFEPSIIPFCLVWKPAGLRSAPISLQSDNSRLKFSFLISRFSASIRARPKLYQVI